MHVGLRELRIRSHFAFPKLILAGRAALDVLPPYLASRILLIGLTLVLATIRQRSPIVLWDVLDSRWYAGIAMHGYAWTLDGKPALAFLPLYPLLIHFGTALGLTPIVSAMLISNCAFCAAFFYIRASLEAEWGPRVTRRALWFVALFPTAFFTFAPYTEGLFVLCAAAAIFHLQRMQTTVAGAWIAAAIMCRSTGLVLLLPLAMMVAWTTRRRVIVAFIPPLASLAIYLVYLAQRHLPTIQLVGSQRHWHRSVTVPWAGFTYSAQYLVTHFTHNAGWTAENLVQLSVTIAGLGVTIAAWRRLSPIVAVYCLGFWALVLCTPEWQDGFFAPFSSVDRFILALFPVAGWVAGTLDGARWNVWIVVSSAVMIGAATVHLSGGWVG